MLIINDFHNTEATIRPKNGFISARSARSCWRKLCGIEGCTCGDALGQRGGKISVIWAGPAGYSVTDRREG